MASGNCSDYDKRKWFIQDYVTNLVNRGESQLNDICMVENNSTEENDEGGDGFTIQLKSLLISRLSQTLSPACGSPLPLH